MIPTWLLVVEVIHAVTLGVIAALLLGLHFRIDHLRDRRRPARRGGEIAFTKDGTFERRN